MLKSIINNILTCHTKTTTLLNIFTPNSTNITMKPKLKSITKLSRTSRTILRFKRKYGKPSPTLTDLTSTESGALIPTFMKMAQSSQNFKIWASKDKTSTTNNSFSPTRIDSSPTPHGTRNTISNTLSNGNTKDSTVQSPNTSTPKVTSMTLNWNPKKSTSTSPTDWAIPSF